MSWLYMYIVIHIVCDTKVMSAALTEDYCILSPQQSHYTFLTCANQFSLWSVSDSHSMHLCNSTIGLIVKSCICLPPKYFWQTHLTQKWAFCLHLCSLKGWYWESMALFASQANISDEKGQSDWNILLWFMPDMAEAEEKQWLADMHDNMDERHGSIGGGAKWDGQGVYKYVFIHIFSSFCRNNSPRLFILQLHLLFSWSKVQMSAD